MNLYSKRREKLMQDLGKNAAVLIFSGKAVMCSEDEAYPFKVNRNFYYLTGLEKEDMVLLMNKYDGKVTETLFILPYDETLARWVGGRMSKQEASDISEVQNVQDFNDLDDYVGSILNRNRKDNLFKFYFDFWHYNVDQTETPAITYANKLKAKYPYLLVKDIYPFLTGMRLVKDEYEITCMKQAIHITNLGIQSMMKICKPTLNEMAMEGAFNFVLNQNVCNENAFKTIAASGERATILHYSENNQVMQDGELFLCDLGATFKHYCADISRTFPVNGKFTERQKEIYELVLQAQRIVEQNAKVGVKIKDLNDMVVNFYEVELPKHGLTKGVREYYFHSISHHLGLDTHDVDGGMGAELQAGNVITNEPGLYIADEGIGIRIEDDLLITGTGAVNLSSEIIKTSEDIENFMRK